MSKKTKSKSPKKTTKKKTTKRRPHPERGNVVVQGPSSVHIFNLEFTLDLAKAAVFKDYLEKQADISFCLSLKKILEKNIPASSWIRLHENPALFRVCAPNRNPLDTSATFGAGGRCNYGMSQRCNEFPIRASYGLYASLDAQTAAIEAASGIRGGHDTVWQIKAKQARPLKLIDYDGVVSFLDSPLPMGLTRIIAETPLYADWSLQHHPKASQVVGEWLRGTLAEHADGLVFTSTKNPTGKNVFLFAASGNSLETDYSAHTT